MLLCDVAAIRHSSAYYAFQLRCSTFAFCYVRIALLCSHYAEAKFLRLEFFEIVLRHHAWGKGIY